jgi:hypothetical protein
MSEDTEKEVKNVLMSSDVICESTDINTIA